MTGITQFLSGKKANMSAGWMFAGAVYLLMNGAMVDTDTGEIVLQNGEGGLAAILTAVSVALSTQRAALAKIVKVTNGVAPMIIGALLIGGYIVGCAAFGQTNPATGNTFGQDLQNEVLNLAPLFGPVLSTVIPLVTGTALNAATILGQMMDAKNSIPTPPTPS